LEDPNPGENIGEGSFLLQNASSSFGAFNFSGGRRYSASGKPAFVAFSDSNNTDGVSFLRVRPQAYARLVSPAPGFDRNGFKQAAVFFFIAFVQAAPAFGASLAKMVASVTLPLWWPFTFVFAGITHLSKVLDIKKTILEDSFIGPYFEKNIAPPAQNFVLCTQNKALCATQKNGLPIKV
jgi:hypothetical protein